jgi:putative phage-type endonuclease
MTPFDLWNGKVLGAAAVENNAMRAGNFLEDGVAKMYLRELGEGYRLRRSPTRRHPKHKWMLATIDRMVVANDQAVKLAEIKLPGSRYVWNRATGERDLTWGFSPDAIPAYVACQAQWQMEVTGHNQCDVVVFFLDSRELAIYPQQRNQSLIDSLMRINERFWHDHVIERVPPAIDGTAGASSYLKQHYPKNDAAMIPAPPEADAVARAYAKASADESEAKKRKDEAGNQLRATIGAHDGIEDHWGKATWKLDARGKVNYQELAGALRSRVELLAAKAGTPELATDLDQLVEQHRDPAPRVLRVLYKLPLEEPVAERPQLVLLDGGAA